MYGNLNFQRILFVHEWLKPLDSKIP
jgi:hypothetical protein